MCKEAEMFTTIVSMAANNMVSYVSLIKIVNTAHLNETERNLEIAQLTIFDAIRRGVFEKSEKCP